MPSISTPLPWPAIVCSVALAAWLLVAAWTDVRTRRIPNLLVKDVEASLEQAKQLSDRVDKF